MDTVVLGILGLMFICFIGLLVDDEESRKNKGDH